MVGRDIVYNSAKDGTFVVPCSVFRTVITAMHRSGSTLSSCNERTLSWGQG